MGNLRPPCPKHRVCLRARRKWSQLAGPSNLTLLEAFGAVVGKTGRLPSSFHTSSIHFKNEVWLCSWIKTKQNTFRRLGARYSRNSLCERSFLLPGVGCGEIWVCSVKARAISFLKDISCSSRKGLGLLELLAFVILSVGMPGACLSPTKPRELC